MELEVSRRLWLHVEIKHDEAFETWLDQFDSLHVFRMREVCVARFCVVEGHDETVSVSIGKSLVRFVGTVFHAEKPWNDTDHGTHFRETFIDLSLCNTLFELKYSEVIGHFMCVVLIVEIG